MKFVCHFFPPINKEMEGQFDDADDSELLSPMESSGHIGKPQSTSDVSKSSKLQVSDLFQYSYEQKREGGEGVQENSDEDDDLACDEMESMLLGEERSGSASKNNGGGASASFGQRVNLSARVQNDIVRSEKKGEKRPNYYGRDDRATSEQVLDPRTRLILFKLLNSGYLTEIDGE